MNILALFDGISAGQLALGNHVIDKYYASEIDEYAIKVTQNNFPKTIQLGNVEDWYFPEGIDIVIGGSPCQGFSFAGKQLNFDDPRSKLFFTFCNILEDIAPKYFLLENVVMKQEFQDIISERLGVKPIKINSALVSAQNRNRLYWTNIPFDIPEDRNIYLKDILLDNPDPKLNHTEKGLDYMDRQVSGGRTHWDFGHHSDCAKSKSACLTTSLAKGVPHNVLIDPNETIRKFDPVEAERLQTFPDNYTDCVSNTQRYKALGNSWTVDIIKEIFKNVRID